MTTSHFVQSSFLSGVLDPRASARIETDAYNQGMKTGVNITPIHLGGVRRRPGLPRRATLPYINTIVGSITATAPQGGTANNAKDDDNSTIVTTTGNVGTVDPYIVVHYDLGSAKAILFADAMGMNSSGGASTQFRIQYSTDNATFADYGTAFAAVDTQLRDYRRTASATARYWRVVKVGGADMGAVTINLADFTLWQAGTTVSEVKTFPFEVSTSERYAVAITDRCATIYNAISGAIALYVPLPYVSADITDIDADNTAETMALVHEDYPQRFLLRETATNFQSLEMEFDTVPQVDFDDSSSPTPVSDVQVITFASGWNQGETFQLGLDGAKTGVIVFAGDTVAAQQTATAANIAREVQKMFSVRGFTGVTCARTGALAYTVTFANGSASDYPLMTAASLSSSASITVAQTAVGTSRLEDLWSATRGYVRTVSFFEGRMYFGGTRSRQQSLLGSEVNNILSFEALEGLDDESIFQTLNGSRGLNAIEGLYAGRSLQIFTSGGEFRYVKEQGQPITPGDAPVNQTQYGSAKIRPCAIDGSTVFIQATRKAVRDFRFDYEQNAYDSLGVSSLAPHLINNVVDLAAWNGSAEDEIGLVFVVNGDGTVAVLNSRKEAQVKAWVQWTTAGLFKSVAVVREDIFFAVRRTINGTDTLFLEQADEDYYTDCAVKVTQAASTTVTGLSHLNGEECRVRGNGSVLENVTPAAGSATVQLASTEIEVGLNFNPECTPMPLNTITPTGPNFLRKRRVVKVLAKVRNTLGLLCNGRPLPDRYYDIDSFDAPADPFTGTHSIEETTNWDQREEKLVTFSQVDPLPFELLGIDIQMESA